MRGCCFGLRGARPAQNPGETVEPPPLLVRVSGAQPVAEEVEGEHRDDHRHDRQHQPRIERDDADVLRLVEEHAPAGERRTQPEPQKRQRGLPRIIDRDHQRRRRDQVAHKARQELAPDDPRRVAPAAYRRCRNPPRAQRQELGAHGAGEVGPLDHAEDQGDAEIDEDLAPRHRQDRRQAPSTAADAETTGSPRMDA